MIANGSICERVRFISTYITQYIILFLSERLTFLRELLAVTGSVDFCRAVYMCFFETKDVNLKFFYQSIDFKTIVLQHSFRDFKQSLKRSQQILSVYSLQITSLHHSLREH
jgi:hypothetical protein